MSKEKIDMLIEGGKATASPALAQQLGPLKINISDVLKQVNDKTLDFKGVKVPVKVIVDTSTKEIEIQVGSPPVSELIKKELNLKKGSGSPNKIKSGNISIEQIIKVSKMKKDAMCANSLKSAVKSVIGSCNSLGILIENKEAKVIAKEVSKGKFDKQINEEITETSPEKRKELDTFFKTLDSKQQQILAAKEKEKEEAAAKVTEEKKEIKATTDKEKNKEAKVNKKAKSTKKK